MRIVVFGAGALGSVLAARLSGGGSAVSLVARAEHVRAIRARGLRVEGIGPGTFGVEAWESLPPSAEADLLLMTVKTFDLATAASSLAPGRCAGIPWLLPQNGLGVEPTVERVFHARSMTAPPLVRAVSFLPATLVAPGVVRQAGRGGFELEAPERAGRRGAATRAFGQLLRSAGLEVRYVPDIGEAVWRKAVLNAAVNPLTAVHGVANGRLEEPPFREEAIGLLAEAHRAAEAAGHRFPLAELERELWATVAATATNRSSMLQDVDRGRPTEIAAISGELLRIGRAHHLPMPRTEAVVARLDAARSRTPAADPKLS